MGGHRERKSSKSSSHTLGATAFLVTEKVSPPLELWAPSLWPLPLLSLLPQLLFGAGDREHRKMTKVLSSLSDRSPLSCSLDEEDGVSLGAVFVYTHYALPCFGVPVSPGWAIMEEK